jgi:hypothetical protein
MQAQSPDGRPVVSVCRPGRWGNPFRVGMYAGMGGRSEACWYLVGHTPSASTPTLVATAEQAVALYRQWVTLSGLNVAPLRGQHLACFCAVGQPCHADLLLELANV